MLRPRDSHTQKVIEANLQISPKPTSLRFIQDAFGNHVGIARFSGRAKDLCFDSTVRIEHEPRDAADYDLKDVPRIFPIQYSAEEVPDLAHCIERRQPDLRNEVTRWAHQFGRPALSSFSPGSRSASIRAFSTDGGKRRESSRPGRRSSSVMAVAAILPC